MANMTNLLREFVQLILENNVLYRDVLMKFASDNDLDYTEDVTNDVYGTTITPREAEGITAAVVDSEITNINTTDYSDIIAFERNGKLYVVTQAGEAKQVEPSQLENERTNNSALSSISSRIFRVATQEDIDNVFAMTIDEKSRELRKFDKSAFEIFCKLFFYIEETFDRIEYFFTPLFRARIITNDNLLWLFYTTNMSNHTVLSSPFRSKDKLSKIDNITQQKRIIENYDEIYDIVINDTNNIKYRAPYYLLQEYPMINFVNNAFKNKDKDYIQNIMKNFKIVKRFDKTISEDALQDIYGSITTNKEKFYSLVDDYRRTFNIDRKKEIFTKLIELSDFPYANDIIKDVIRRTSQNDVLNYAANLVKNNESIADAFFDMYRTVPDEIYQILVTSTIPEVSAIAQRRLKKRKIKAEKLKN